MRIMVEFIDEIDSSGNFIAKRPASDLKKRMFMHRVALVIPKAAGGKIILSKRAATKRPFPGTFCCAVGGKISHGETEEQAAEREMNEEIGKSYPVRRVASFVFDEPDYKAAFTVFTTIDPVSASEFVLDKREIEYSRPFSKEEIKRMVKEKPEAFSPTFIAAIKESIDQL
jgi:8-oxo-dGTP pyrophosphatase MutT (NUDIX family)